MICGVAPPIATTVDDSLSNHSIASYSIASYVTVLGSLE